METAMKNTNLSTKFSFLGLLLLLATFGQMQVLAQKVRKSPNATVTQRVGLTDITITYCRPGVKGRTIWGDLVPYGMNPGSEYTKGKEFPWRAGANENTTIKFSKDVHIEGKDLAAGIYGVHMIPGKEEWVVIFSKNSTSWGSYSYKAEEDGNRCSWSDDHRRNRRAQRVAGLLFHRPDGKFRHPQFTLGKAHSPDKSGSGFQVYGYGVILPEAEDGYLAASQGGGGGAAYEQVTYPAVPVSPHCEEVDAFSFHII